MLICCRQSWTVVDCFAAAGGGFRSKPGRLFFQTTELCQSIFKPNLATNKVPLAAFVELLPIAIWHFVIGILMSWLAM